MKLALIAGLLALACSPAFAQSNGSVGTVNQTAPGSATQIGMKDGSGKLQPISSTNPLPVSGGGGGAVYGPTADGSPAANPPVVIGGTSDGGPTGTVGVVKVDTSGFLYDIPTPLRSTTTDRGVTITTGGTSQQFAASNTARNRITIQNPTSATGQGISVAENCQVNFGAAASQTAGTSFDLSPGGSFDSGSGPVPTDAVNVVCATTGHKVIAKEW